MKKDIKRTHKIFLTCVTAFCVVFLVFTLFMGISNKFMSEAQTNIVFWVWFGFTIACIGVFGGLYFPIKKALLKHIIESYSFDQTKVKKLKKTHFEVISDQILELDFQKDGLLINETKYEYQDLLFQYSALDSHYAIKLYISKLVDLQNDIMYMIDVDKDLFDCLNFYDLNIREFNACLDELKKKLKK